jgi:hypothetical protein
MPSASYTRRGVLGVGGTTLALLAGCLGSRSSPEEASENPTQTTTTTTTSEPADVTVSNVQTTPELVALDSPDSIGTFGERDEQFVLVTILVEGESGPPVEAFSLTTDESSFEPIPPNDLPAYGRLWNRGYAYDETADLGHGGQSGYLVFRVPKPLEPAGATFRGPGGQFALDSNVRRRLARPPTEFVVNDVTAPEAVESGREVTVSATIENTGSADGTFVGALNRVGPLVAYTPVERVELELSAGESTTWTHSHWPTLDSGTEPRPMRFKLNWRDGRISTETTVEPPSYVGED